MVRALAFHQCGLGSIPGFEAICRVSLSVLYSAPRSFSRGTMRARIRLKLARVDGRKNARERFDVGRLHSEEIRRKYNVEVRNRFESLGDKNMRRRKNMI